MAILRKKSGCIICKNFPVNAPGVIQPGYVLVFEKESDYKAEKTPDWYKLLANRSFKVLDIVVNCEWSNGGISPGFGTSIEYVVEES